MWKAIGKFFSQAPVLGALISLLDPEIRRWAEEIAGFVRKRIVFSNDQQRMLAERAFGAIRGAVEQLIISKVPKRYLVVILEKFLVDLPDFIASYIFQENAGVEEWLTRRKARARQLMRERGLSKEEITEAEAVLDQVYTDLQASISELRSDGGTAPSISGGLLQMEESSPEKDTELAAKTHPEAGGLIEALRKKVGSLDEKLADALERAAHMDFDDEQRAVIEAKKAKLGRLQRERRFRGASEDLDERIAKERERLGE